VMVRANQKKLFTILQSAQGQEQDFRAGRSPREPMDCNGEPDRKDDKCWQHDCEANCICIHR
jgi:hypothetical protein